MPEDDLLDDIKIVEPQKLKKVASKPRAKPANAENIIDKLSGQMGVDKGFWMEFENSVLKEIRTTVEEVDPIEWLMQIAESETGYNGNPNTALKSSSSKGSDWDNVEAVLNTLNEIDKM